MGKVFGYPEFDANGEKILTTYDNDYKEMLMDIRVFRLKAGDVKTLHGMETRRLSAEKMYLQKDPGQYISVQEPRSQWKQRQTLKSWYSPQ